VTPSISVVIPTYNKAALLEPTLRALAAQENCPDYEVVVVDDGSSDTTAEVLQTMRRYEPAAWSALRVEADGVNRGRAGARNVGLAAAAAEYVVFLDDDCLTSPTFVSAHHAVVASEDREVMVLGATMLSNEVSGEDLSPSTVAAHRRAVAAVDSGEWTTSWNCFVSNHAGVTATAARRVAGFDEGFVGWGEEDIDFGYRLHKAGCKARGLTEFVVKSSHRRDLHNEGREWLRNYVHFTRKHGRPIELLFRWQIVMGVMSIYQFDYLTRMNRPASRRRAEREYEAFVRAAESNPERIQHWLMIREAAALTGDPLFARDGFGSFAPGQSASRGWLTDPEAIVATLDRMADEAA